MRFIVTVVLLAVALPVSAQTPTPTWRLVENLRIGNVDGPVALSSVFGLTVSPDGKVVYLTQRRVYSIWMFDAATGRKLGEIGRKGGGPGEFEEVPRIGWRADSLYAADLRLQRVTLFSRTGEYLRSEQITYPILPETKRGTFPIGYTVEGTVAQSSAGSRERAEGWVTSTPIVLLDGDGQIIRSLAHLDLRNTTGAAAVGTGVVYFPQPMSQRTHFGLDPSASSMVIVTQPAASDPPGVFNVVRIRMNGDTIYSRSFRYPPRPVSRQLADSLFDHMAGAFGRLATPAQGRRAAEEYYAVPKFHPPITNLSLYLVVSPRGSVWLRREDVGNPTVRWLVLDPNGTIRASLAAPADLNILHANDSIVWGTVSDDLDVPYVVRYQIQR